MRMAMSGNGLGHIKESYKSAVGISSGMVILNNNNIGNANSGKSTVVENRRW